MKIDIPTQRTIRKIIREEIVKNDRSTMILINMLKRRIVKLEDKISPKYSKLHRKEKPIRSEIFKKNRGRIKQ
jgi:hypothetical protein